MSLTKIEKENIDLKFKAVHIKMDSEFGVINKTLVQILAQTTKHNQRMSKIEECVDDIEKREITHVVDCPIAAQVRDLEDSALSVKAIKKWVVGSVSVTGGLMGVLWIIFQVLQNKP